MSKMYFQIKQKIQVINNNIYNINQQKMKIYPSNIKQKKLYIIILIMIIKIKVKI